MRVDPGPTHLYRECLSNIQVRQHLQLRETQGDVSAIHRGEPQRCHNVGRFRRFGQGRDYQDHQDWQRHEEKKEEGSKMKSIQQ